MGEFMDKSFIAMGNTVLSYCGQHSLMRLPVRLGNVTLSGIGDGAFMESPELQSILLPPGIREIGSRAFYSCQKLTSIIMHGGVHTIKDQAFRDCIALRDVTICDLEVSESLYNSLKNTSIRAEGDLYIASRMPDIWLVQEILKSICNIRPAVHIPVGIPYLFQMAELDENKGHFSLDKNIPVIGFSVPSVPMTENTAFRGQITKGFQTAYSGKAEEKNDWHIRVGNVPFAPKTALFTFDDTKTKKENGRYLIHAALMLGFFFWTAVQPVVYENKRYYVCGRCYLTDMADMEYLRRDIAVYTDRGVVNDRREAREVYAKYKLLSIL